MLKPLTGLLLFLLICGGVMARQNQYFFRKLGVADGLNDGNILVIAQDAKGFMWFATRSGLNRYDGYSVKTYSYIAGDSTSLPTALIRSMAADSIGNFWVGTENGLLQYDAGTDRFLPVKALDNIWVGQIIAADKHTLYLGTSKGLIAYDIDKRQALHYMQGEEKLLHTRVYDATWHHKQLYLATANGLLQFNPATQTTIKITIPAIDNEVVIAVAVDDKDNCWLATRGATALLKYNLARHTADYYGRYFESGPHTIANFTSLMADGKGRIWVTTQLNGLLYYNETGNRFDAFLHNPLQVWTPSTNLHSALYHSNDGTIWVGGNNGINYFHPDKNLFRIIPVFDREPDIRNRRVARLAVEDKKGMLWFGTMDGLVRYNPVTEEYREWNNREDKAPTLHYNSVRGLLCDEDNNIWIATGKGINLFRQHENKMVFFSEKDSIPAVFYFSADKDRAGNYWFGSRDRDGFYYYDSRQKTFHSIRQFPGLSEYSGIGGRKLLHDSKGRYWLGFNGDGLAMYDPVHGKHYRWKADNDAAKSIAGNIVVDIKEDKNGVIWISTFTGLSAIDPASLSIRNYNSNNGLINNNVSALAIDNDNRLWMGTGSGLMMLDSTRTYFTAFGLKDGLPSIEFPEHASSVLSNGDLLFPTQNGFIRFAPGDYKRENNSLQPYFTTIHISGRRPQLVLDNAIKLRHNEGFFSIGFGAINFDNAAGNWYAYKLEGIDKEWKYTQNRFADYTRIPGGDYVFKVKAAAGREQWSGSELQLRIQIGSIFYNTLWFRALAGLLLLSVAYVIYRYRIRQKEKLMQLQSKAQLLEKEKALVMYESLKQQLNPHFLFNSLSSLSGLIEADQKMAGNFLEQMSKIYRYILKSRDSELVSLKEEIDFVQTYISLQKTRFGDGLQVQMRIADADKQLKIVPVTLQNLLENAIKHNVVDIEAPLIVEMTTADGYLEVKNNLQRKKMLETSNKQGLASLRSLYKYLSKKPVEVNETKTTFVVRIPLIEA
ncbi:MAG: two-component regulator propeller domain-containing protein [Chitinophagaceae bacterium]